MIKFEQVSKEKKEAAAAAIKKLCDTYGGQEKFSELTGINSSTILSHVIHQRRSLSTRSTILITQFCRKNGIKIDPVLINPTFDQKIKIK